MKELYFNMHEFRKALEIQSTNPYESCARFKDYIEKYPLDYAAYAYYATTLIIIGKAKDAEIILKKAFDLANNDTKFKENTKKYNSFMSQYYFTICKLYCYNKEYQKAYDLITAHKGEINFREGTYLFYLKKKLNLLCVIDKSGLSYIFHQIYEYDESLFREHILKHTQEHSADLDNQNKGYFFPEFPLEEVLKEARKYIPSDKGLFNGFIDEEYTFKYPVCGKHNNKVTDYFIIDAFHGTTDFITMCPCDMPANDNYVDLSYLIKEDCATRRLSQIDKFNKRFNL